MAFVSCQIILSPVETGDRLRGRGGVDPGGHLEIHSNIHNTDFRYVIECCIFDAR